MTARPSPRSYARTYVLAEPAPERAPWPPPPHDPRERELLTTVEGWEVRVFDGRKFEYFVTRGFWHLQLWHAASGVSILTPSRLTCGFYEAYPIESWKAQASEYRRIDELVRREHRIEPPSARAMKRIEKAFVSDLVRAQGRPVS